MYYTALWYTILYSKSSPSSLSCTSPPKELTALNTLRAQHSQQLGTGWGEIRFLIFYNISGPYWVLATMQILCWIFIGICFFTCCTFYLSELLHGCMDRQHLTLPHTSRVFTRLSRLHFYAPAGLIQFTRLNQHFIFISSRFETPLSRIWHNCLVLMVQLFTATGKPSLGRLAGMIKIYFNVLQGLKPVRSQGFLLNRLTKQALPQCHVGRSVGQGSPTRPFPYGEGSVLGIGL